MNNLNQYELLVLSIIDKNLPEINILNYDLRMKKILKETRHAIRDVDDDELKNEIYHCISEVMYHYLFDIYEEVLRDKRVWDDYFKKISKQIQIAEIDNKSASDVEDEVEKGVDAK